MRAALVVVAILLASSAHARAQTREPGAYVIVLDRSSSMRGDKLELVKSAVLEAIDGLQPADLVAVVAVAGTARTIAPLQPAVRAKIARQLAGLGTASGDNLAAGLDAAIATLSQADRKTRHIVVITDSAPSRSLGAAVVRVYNHNVSMSAVGVDLPSSAVLAQLAGADKGNQYAVEQLEMLPLTVGKAFVAPVPYDGNAVVFVIDRSGSMSGPKLEAARESVRVAAEVLAPEDEIAVVTFDSEAAVLVPLQRAGNRARTAALLARLDTGGGTNIFPGLKLAYEMLKPIQNRRKLVILLTDGEAPSDGIAELVQDMKTAQISISAIGVQGADRNLLSMIADAGDGRLYMVEDIGALPKIFMTEATR